MADASVISAPLSKINRRPRQREFAFLGAAFAPSEGRQRGGKRTNGLSLVSMSISHFRRAGVLVWSPSRMPLIPRRRAGCWCFICSGRLLNSSGRLSASEPWQGWPRRRRIWRASATILPGTIRAGRCHSLRNWNPVAGLCSPCPWPIRWYPGRRKEASAAHGRAQLIEQRPLLWVVHGHQARAPALTPACL